MMILCSLQIIDSPFRNCRSRQVLEIEWCEKSKKFGQTIFNNYYNYHEILILPYKLLLCKLVQYRTRIFWIVSDLYDKKDASF